MGVLRRQGKAAQGCVKIAAKNERTPSGDQRGFAVSQGLKQVWNLLLGCQVGLSEHQGDRC